MYILLYTHYNERSLHCFLPAMFLIFKGVSRPGESRLHQAQVITVMAGKPSQRAQTACDGVSRRVTATLSRHPGPTKGSHALIESKHSALQSQLSIYVYIYMYSVYI